MSTTLREFYFYFETASDILVENVNENLLLWKLFFNNKHNEISIKIVVFI